MSFRCFRVVPSCYRSYEMNAVWVAKRSEEIQLIAGECMNYPIGERAMRNMLTYIWSTSIHSCRSSRNSIQHTRKRNVTKMCVVSLSVHKVISSKLKPPHAYYVELVCCHILCKRPLGRQLSSQIRKYNYAPEGGWYCLHTGLLPVDSVYRQMSFICSSCYVWCYCYHSIYLDSPPPPTWLVLACPASNSCAKCEFGKCMHAVRAQCSLDFPSLWLFLLRLK